MSLTRLTCNNKRIGAVTLSNDALAIGRHPDNDIPLKGDDVASRFHCVVEPSTQGGHQYVLRDLGSRNGTRLNGQKISEVRLSPGDVIAVGRHTFAVEVLDEAPEEHHAPPPGNGQSPPRKKAAGARGKAKQGSKEHARTATATREKNTKARRHGAGAPAWVQELYSTIDSLPPKSTVDESLTLIDANGHASNALEGDSDGPRAVRLLLVLASKARATDIHFEPRNERFSIRTRVDGQMVHLVDLPQAVGELALGVLRTACQMKQAARDAVQDGHFSVRFSDRRVDFRASFTPTVSGQKLVVRVLDSHIAPQSLADLNMPGYMHDRIRKVVDQDQGMTMVCGPTGSGKTTTLYNGLREIDRERRNIVTIEDPVEYELEGVTQIPVGKSTFGELLRSVLRQDPDVILVGEIRDDETARVAMQAAMTGHVVFSTIHSKDTIGSIFRLIDLGVEPYLVANSLDVILAQRLVRTLCDYCKRPVRVTPSQATRIGRFLEGKTEVYAATGCAKCLRTGFKGREAIFEMLVMNDELRDTVLTTPSIQVIKRIVEQGVFTTLQQSGWLMAARGETTLDEVERVCGG